MKTWQMLLLAGLFVLVILVLCAALNLAMPFIAGPTPTPTNTPNPTPTSAPTATHIPTASPEPVITVSTSPSDQIENLLWATLGWEARGLPKITDLTVETDPIMVILSWTIADSFTEGLIKDGLWYDVRDVARALVESPYRVHRLSMEGSFPMKDVYGKVTEDIVVRVTFEEETLYQVEWTTGGIDIHNIYLIADDLYLHPEFAW